MIGDLTKAITQVFDRRFLGVLLKSVALTVLLLLALSGLALWLLSLLPSLSVTIPLVGYEITFLDELTTSLSIGLLLALSIFLMFPVAAIFVSLFLDEIADAVERRHYPHLPEPRRQTLGEVLTQGIEFSMVLIGANIVALVIYLLVTFLAPVIFWIVNGYLLGREYFEVVAMRRMDKRDAKRLRQKHFMTVWLAGVFMAIPLSVPVLNIVAPLVGVAAFVHLYHRKMATPGAPLAP
ncbi:MAG: EI24 domain-containing protein, partial [Pseudomonadota bacterium]